MNIIGALKAGQSLKNPEFWKRIQLWLIALSSFLPFAVYFYPELQTIIDNDLLVKLAGGFGGIATMYLTVATTDKIGVQ